MSTKVGPNSQHGAATRNAGCSCSTCKAAARDRARRYRAHRRKKLAATPGVELPYPCRHCDSYFATKRGRAIHAAALHDDFGLR